MLNRKSKFVFERSCEALRLLHLSVASGQLSPARHLPVDDLTRCHRLLISVSS